MASYEYDARCLKVFLEKQTQLFPKEVAHTPEEAAEFLEESMAVVCGSPKEVREYLEEEMDISDMDMKELLQAEEVFALGDGRYLIVEG